MKDQNGNALIWLLILVVAIIVWAECYVSNGKPFSYLANSATHKPYQTYEEHMAQKERERRISELKKKVIGYFSPAKVS